MHVSTNCILAQLSAILLLALHEILQRTWKRDKSHQTLLPVRDTESDLHWGWWGLGTRLSILPDSVKVLSDAPKTFCELSSVSEISLISNAVASRQMLQTGC